MAIVIVKLKAHTAVQNCVSTGRHGNVRMAQKSQACYTACLLVPAAHVQAGHGGAPSSEEESLTSGEGDAAESHRALAHGHNYGSRLHQPQPAQPPSWQEQHQQPAPIPAPGLGACGAWMPGVGGAGQAGAGLLQAIRVHLRARGFGRGPEGAEEEGMGGEAGAPEAAPLGQGILVSALNTLSRSLSPEHMPHARSGQMPHVLHAVSPDDSLLFSVGTGSPATRKQWSASLPHIRTDHLHHARSEHGPHTHTSHEDSDDGNMTDAGSQFSDNEELLAEALVEAEEGQVCGAAWCLLLCPCLKSFAFWLIMHACQNHLLLHSHRTVQCNGKALGCTLHGAYLKSEEAGEGMGMCGLMPWVI